MPSSSTLPAAFGTTFTRCFMIGLLAQAQPMSFGMMCRS
jgi:hypothetical protein